MSRPCTARPRRAAPLALMALLACAPAPAQQPPSGLAEMRAFARNLLVTERYEEAVNAYITIARETPENARSHYDLAGAMVFLRMYADAVPSIERAVELDPDNVLYLEMAAMTHQQLRHHEKAFDYTLRGAEAGDIKAMYSVAGMYEHGRGTAASPAGALLWLERSARAGHMSAMDAMARVYRDGLYGQQPDPARVADWERALDRAMQQ